ncbi:MAG: J domain-containing protein [Desulfobacterales bacterium]|nr:J domain-containing protein [Desulfobacterales bacterium]
MYLARTVKNASTTYSLRESYQDTGALQSREIFKLGTDPSQFINYPGGNAYYFDDLLVETLKKYGVTDIDSRLDDLLWDFLKPEIRKTIGHFSHARRSPPQASLKAPPAAHHLFDKRRVLFLKSGTLDQGPVGRLPGKLFRVLDHKSRDEIEQYFLAAEHVLKPAELKIYTYVIFDLQKHFTSPLAKRFPSAMGGEKLDSHFVKAACRLNDDRSFWRGLPLSEGLNEYLSRYIVMYFDNHFPEEDFRAGYVRDFMHSRRGFRFPEKPAPVMSLADASQVLGLSPEQLTNMSKTLLTRHYRKMAIERHPDQGGDHDKFIQITEAYQAALNRIKKN